MQEANSTKKFLIKRIIAFVCVLSILVSLCVVPASAQFDGIHDTNSVAAWESQINPGSELMDIVSGFLGENVDARGAFWFLFDAFTGPDVGEIPLPDLISRAEQLNRTVSVSLEESFFGQIFENIDGFTNTVFYTMLGLEPMNFEVQYDENREYYRIRDVGNDIWYVNSSGEHYYSYGDSNQATIGDHWIHITQATNELFSSHVDLKDASHLKKTSDMMNLGGQVTSIGTLQGRGEIKYKAIRKGDYVWANSDGYPYVSPADDPYWIILDGDRGPDTDVKDENGDDVEGLPDGNITGIDLSGMTVNLPDGLFAFIDNITYDESQRAYYIDASTNYNIDNVNITNNYYFKWEYHINYTSITYIGQTEEYDKYYEVYYELPDGRSSADLTKEDLEQLNLAVDVIPYERVADDTSLRSLYHFDGDTRDASYWNYCTDFAWKTGASLTYMDSGAFNGALYLDEKEHEFTITLPSAITAADFTLQFRYYQGYTAAAVNDSYISFGDVVVMRMNGTHLMKQTSTKMAEMPIGSWNEIAFMRKGSKHYWYLNGVCLASGTGFNGTTFEDTITFHFGSEQQTFKYLDELRFLDYALVSDGANYTPTSVPHDTNLSLVLPEGSTVVADEYWEIQSSKTNLLKMKPEDFMSSTLPSWYVKDFDDDYENGHAFPRWSTTDWTYGGEYVDGTLGAHDGFLRLSTVLNYTNAPAFTSNGMRAAFMTRLGTDGEIPWQTGWPDTGLLTLSIVLADGSIYSVPYDLENDYERLDTFSWGKMGFIYEDDTWFIVVHPTYNTSIDIMYMELCAGTTDLSAEWVESVTVIPNENIKTPTLAVRTDIDITSYQIGGVRPSIPEKGLVWALVESDRITSIQIYNGQAWEGVDGRIWTGSRWIPASSYNIVTLQDMYDIVDSTPNFEYIYTESGFWTWWQKSWNAFTEKLLALLGSGGSGGGGNQETNNYDFDSDVIIVAPGAESGKSFWQFVLLCVDGGKAVVKGVRYLFDGVVSMVPDSMDSITDSFDSGGSAVSITEGKDPDAADMPEAAVAVDESEVLDPWRYR